MLFFIFEPNSSRRQFPSQNDFYHNHNHHYNNNHSHNGNGYYNRGGPRGYSESCNGGYRNENNNQVGGGSNGVTPLASPEFEEYLPWPAKRGCGPPDENYYGNYYSPNSRNCSPDNSPTSDCSGSFPETGQTRDIVLNNGSVITAQSLGPYEYFVGNLHRNNCYPYPGFAGNYFYGQSAAVATDRDSSNVDSMSLVTGGSMGPPPPPLSNTSSRAESCTNSPAAEKATDWPDGCSDTDSEAAEGTRSTRSHTPEEDYPDLTVTVESGWVLINDLFFIFFKSKFVAFRN